jgi:hypothetical protein
MGGTTVDREPGVDGALKWQIFNRPTKKAPKWLIFKVVHTAFSPYYWDVDSGAVLSPLPAPPSVNSFGLLDRFLLGILKINVYQGGNVGAIARINTRTPADFGAVEIPTRQSDTFFNVAENLSAAFIGYDLSRLPKDFYYFDFIGEEYLNPTRNVGGGTATAAPSSILAFTASRFPDAAPTDFRLEVDEDIGKQVARSSTPAMIELFHNPPSSNLQETVIGENFSATYWNQNYLYKYDASDPSLSGFVKVRLGARIASPGWSYPPTPPATNFGWSARTLLDYLGPESVSYYYNESTNQWLIA